MDFDLLLTLKWVFYGLAAMVVRLPPRWGVLMYLVLVHFDLTTSETRSVSSVGLENAIKVLVLPALLLVRMRLRPLHRLAPGGAARFWLVLLGYAATATLWSSYQIAALKMVGYLMSYLALFVIFAYALRRNWLTQSSLLAAVWAGLAIAVIQTYLIPGNTFVLENDRFTSFSSPQSFAAYLLCAMSLLLFCGEGGLLRAITLPVLMVSILLTGSRYVLIGLLALLTLYWASCMFHSGSAKGAIAVFFKGVAGVLLVSGLLAAFLSYKADSRLRELVTDSPYGRSSIQDVGTLVWRMGVYEHALRAVSGHDLVRLIFGAGTSDGAEFMLEYDRRYGAERIDANRVLHNEFLRALYEWGIVGLLLLTGFLVAILLAAVRRIMKDKSQQVLAIVGICPAVLISLSVENVLAGAGGPVGAGYTLVLAWGLAAERYPGRLAAGRVCRAAAGGQFAPSWSPGWPAQVAGTERRFN